TPPPPVGPPARRCPFGSFGGLLGPDFARTEIFRQQHRNVACRKPRIHERVRSLLRAIPGRVNSKYRCLFVRHRFFSLALRFFLAETFSRPEFLRSKLLTMLKMNRIPVLDRYVVTSLRLYFAFLTLGRRHR